MGTNMQNKDLENAWADIEIRLARDSDAQEISDVLAKSFEEYKSSYTSAAFEVSAPDREAILDRMREGPVWVAVQDGEILGTISAVPMGSMLCLRGLGVPPEARGKALGKLLLMNAARYAFTNGFRRMTLRTAPFLTRANREYEHFGFQRADDGAEELHGTPHYKMVKQL
jgi:GNAT superfamily N-acetyltransferase